MGILFGLHQGERDAAQLAMRKITFRKLLTALVKKLLKSRVEIYIRDLKNASCSILSTEK